MLMLVGPEGAGKSHLGAIWARAAGAVSLAGEGLDEQSLEACARASAVLLEDADCATRAEALFFHLINAAMQNDVWLMLTCRTAPDAWGIGTPDLLSRLRLAPVVRLAAPDIELTEAVLFKLFSDRQLQVEPHVIAYVALRIERSLGAARELVAVLDNEALTQGRRITRTMASDASVAKWPCRANRPSRATNLCLPFINCRRRMGLGGAARKTEANTPEETVRKSLILAATAIGGGVSYAAGVTELATGPSTDDSSTWRWHVSSILAGQDDTNSQAGKLSAATPNFNQRYERYTPSGRRGRAALRVRRVQAAAVAQSATRLFDAYGAASVSSHGYGA